MTNWKENKAKWSTCMPFQKTISEEKQVSLNIACWILTLGVDVLLDFKSGIMGTGNWKKKKKRRSANHGGRKRRHHNWRKITNWNSTLWLK